MLASSAPCQTSAERYADAHRRLSDHSGKTNSFLHDDSPQAIAAIRDLWSSVASYLIDLRQQQPKISVEALDHALCLLTTESVLPNNPDGIVPQTTEAQCAPDSNPRHQIAEVAPHLLLVTLAQGELGTVLLIDDRIANPAILWSIADAQPTPLDPNHLIAAWKAERDGERCRFHEPRDQDPCGPLYGSPILLTPDRAGHPRFAIDSTFARWMGGTGDNVTSIWQWDGHRASLLWIAPHESMLDDPPTTFDGYETLTIHSKGERNTFGDCGSCNSAPMTHQVLVEPSRVRDLGIQSLAPELDLIDALFWRTHQHLPTTQIAAADLVSKLAPQIRQAEIDSAKVQGNGVFYIGMIMSSVVQRTRTGANVCLVVDGIDQNRFVLQRQVNGGYFIVSGQVGEEDCEERASPPPPASPPSI